MPKRMLIDATHLEETRVVLLNGTRLEEYDFETSTKKQLKGNIYLAKVTRVEPSLQACFVEFGGGRHGFLAFGEIHPDYWQIPVADREALLAEQRRHAERDQDHDGDEPSAETEGRPARRRRRDSRESREETERSENRDQADRDLSSEPGAAFPMPSDAEASVPPPDAVEPTETVSPLLSPWDVPLQPMPLDVPSDRIVGPEPSEASGETASPGGEMPGTPLDATQEPTIEADSDPLPAPVPLESIGGEGADDDDDDEEETRRPRFKPMRHYKIQEVIKRRQVLLVQVVKEERGNKGAALTTYISLAGRYCVLMPNTTRGGGISRRITSAQDRKRLKDIMHDLDVPDGMAVILRTAGMERAKPEIRRDYEYLMRLWDDVRELTLNSRAPTLVYEEGSLIKRSIRDLFTRDIDEVQVEGQEGYDAALAFMKMLMPDHAEKIRLYDDPQIPLFQRHQVEAQLDEMHESSVRLRSGGYIVLNQTEALVAIDVNSGRATRERHIEETALKTNLEAADEVARQVRLRDLAGLIVIDFIDMEDSRHIAQVERRLKEAMRSDRARIQIGRISPFGLMELSRQRLRPSLAEVSTQKCPHCSGSGFIRSTESTALRVLRGIEEAGTKSHSAAIKVSVPASVAIYILNQKRIALSLIERRHDLEITFDPDDSLVPPNYRLEKLKIRDRDDIGPAPVRAGVDMPEDEPRPLAAEEPQDRSYEPPARSAPPRSEGAEATEDAEASPQGDDARRGRKRRRRRGRGRGREDGGPQNGAAQAGGDESAPYGGTDMAEASPMAMQAGEPGAPDVASDGGDEPGVARADLERIGDDDRPEGQRNAAREGQPGGDDESGRRRRRGRRGGRRRRPNEGPEGTTPAPDFQEAAMPVAQPVAAPQDPDDELRARARELYAPSSRFGEDPVTPPAPSPRAEAHEWPWNRRTEIQPPTTVTITPTAADMPPPAAMDAEIPVAAMITAPAVIAATPPAAPTPAPEPVPAAIVAETEPQQGPARKGWWRRLTS